MFLTVLFFAGLLFSLNGVFTQDAYADTCSGIEGSFAYADILLLITITNITLDPKIHGEEWSDSYQYYNAEFTVDKVVQGPENYTTSQKIIQILESAIEDFKEGTQYVAIAYLPEDSYNGNSIYSYWGCNPNLAPASYIDYSDFIQDLTINQCDEDKDYLVKFSDFEKICVSTQTRDNLVDRHYGFYLPELDFRTWHEIVDNGIDVSEYYNEKLNCRYDHFLQRDYCLPTNYIIELDYNDGNALVTINPLPNIGQSAKVTIYDDNPKLDYKWDRDSTVWVDMRLDQKLDFVTDDMDSEDLEKMTVYGNGGSQFAEEVPADGTPLFLEKTIVATYEGNTRIHGSAARADDYLYLHISEETLPYWPLQDLDGNKIKVTFSIDKKQYNYPESIHITAHFDGDIGKYVAIYDPHSFYDPNNSTLVYLDDQNNIDFDMDVIFFDYLMVHAENHDNFQLQLRDTSDGMYEIPFIYYISSSDKRIMQQNYYDMTEPEPSPEFYPEEIIEEEPIGVKNTVIDDGFVFEDLPEDAMRKELQQMGYFPDEIEEIIKEIAEEKK